MAASGAAGMTLVIGTASFLVAIWTVRIDRTPAFYAPWNRFWELLAGATLACIEADAELRVLHGADHRRVPWVPNVLAIAGALMIAAGVIADSFHARVPRPVGPAAGRRHLLSSRGR